MFANGETIEGWINRYIFLGLALAGLVTILVALPLWQLYHLETPDHEASAPVESPIVEATIEPIATPTAEPLQAQNPYSIGMTYFSMGSHRLCYPDGGRPNLGYVNCSPFYVDNGDLVRIVGGPDQGIDGLLYWSVQVIRGSMFAEVGESGPPPAIWWLEDTVRPLIPVAPPHYLLEAQPLMRTDLTYEMEWSYKLRSWAAGPTIHGSEGPELVAGGGVDVTFTGEVEVGDSLETGLGWWCRLASLAGISIEQYLTHLPEGQRKSGAWVPCEAVPKS